MSRRIASSAGALAGLGSAVLFGAGAPVAKLLLGDISPWLLAGLLYTASGLALFAWRLVRRSPRVHLARADIPPLAGAIVFGGVLGPVLLMLGLSAMPASGASLLLNAEGVFTALIAWVVFREATDRRVVAGFALIALGAVVLSWPGAVEFSGVWPAAAVLGACLCWGIDNNLTRQVALTDATWLAAVKGAVAGPVNLVLALVLGATLPGAVPLLGAAAVGVVSYGISLVLFITALAKVGTARAGAYYSVAPFVGAGLAVALGDPLGWPLVVAAVLMGAGVWLHLTEAHVHEHTHEPITHEHWHTHDDGHHDHVHEPPVPAGVRHRHVHTHEPVTHSHPHFPDSHHRHSHGHAEV
ncbi:DMT family transporter [Propionicicella superfundia]|uniref:DMT family transporter n=1 Tax=Propionicicella superfundia TaxID=348582 RepID=UPI000424B721|nr:DMT family transporter [Propionicicella superfundia]